MSLLVVISTALVGALLAPPALADERRPTVLTLDQPMPESLDMDEPLTLAGHLLRGDEPGADLPLRITVFWIAPQPVVVHHDVMTDGGGRFHFSAPPGRSGDYHVTVSYAGDDRFLPASLSGRVPVNGIPTTLTVSVPSEPVTSGDTMVIGGRVIDDEGRPVSGATLLLRLWGAINRDVHPVTTEDGTFTYEMTATNAGPTSAGAYFFEDGRHAPSHHLWETFQTLRRPGRLTVEAPAEVLVGEPIHITGVLTDEEGVADRSNILFGYPDSEVNGGGEDEAVTADDGSFAFTHPAQIETGGIGFTVSAPRPSRVTPQREYFIVDVTTPTMRSRALADGRHGRRAATYRAGDGAAIVTRVAPRRTGLCLRFQVEERRDGRWRREHTSACRRTDSTARALFDLPGRHQAGDRYRVRPVWRSIAGTTRGRWVRLRFA